MVCMIDVLNSANSAGSCAEESSSSQVWGLLAQKVAFQPAAHEIFVASIHKIHPELDPQSELLSEP